MGAHFPSCLVRTGTVSACNWKVPSGSAKTCTDGVVSLSIRTECPYVLAAALAPHRDRFLLSAVLRPNFTGWQDDLLRCAEDYGARAVLLYPQYHRYELLSPETGDRSS